VRVLVEEVLAEMAGVELRWVYRVLLGLDVDGVLDRVSGYNNTVVCPGVSGPKR
jgi:Fe2+ or Zn2+ uptake regulation protein